MQLQEEIRLLKIIKEKETLEKEIRATQPSPTATPLQGTATGADKLTMEIEMQSYKAMRRVTDRIACNIRKNVPSAQTIVLFRPEDYAAWRNYKLLTPALRTHLGGMKTEYEGWLDRANFFIANRGVNAVPAATPTAVPTPAVGAGSPTAFLSAFTTSLSGATTAVRSLSDLLASFRTDIEFSAKDVSIDEAALRAGLANSLRRVGYNGASNQCESIRVNLTPVEMESITAAAITATAPAAKITVFDPGTFSITMPPGGAFTSDILTNIEELTALKRRAEIEIADYETVVADSQRLTQLEESLEKKKNAQLEKAQIVTNITLEKAKAAADKKPDFDKAIEAAKEALNLAIKEVAKEENRLIEFAKQFDKIKFKLEAPYRWRISRLKQLNAEFTQFVSDFTKSTNGISPLTQVVKAENMDKVLNQNAGNTYWLQVKSIKAGGSTRVRKNLFRYFYGPDIAHSGGSIVEFALSDNEGKVVLTNTEAVYQNYQKASTITSP